MDSITCHIIKIDMDNDNFYIETQKGKFYAPIIKGSIEIEVYNSENKRVPISYLENDDIIKIKHKNYKIIKIVINTKYQILSESSEEIIL